MRYSCWLACLIGILAFAGCSPLKKEINKRYPPMNLAAATEAASAEALEGLEKLSRADLYVGVSDGDIQRLAPAAIQQAEPRIKDVKLELGRQAIIFNVDFDGAFAEAGFAAAGELNIAAAPSINGLELQVRPVAQRIKLRKLKILKGGPLEGKEHDISFVAPIITAALNTFIENINGQIKAYRTELNFATSLVLRPEEILRDLPGASDFSGQPYKVDAAMEQGSVLIDSRGLHALVQSTLTRTEIAPALQAETAQDLSPGDAYERFAQSFRDVGAANLGEGLESHWGDTAAGASSTFISAIVNTAANPIGFGANFTIPGFVGRINELIEIETTWDFDCSQSDMDCTYSHMTCSDHRSCDPKWSCPSCKWYQVDCHARKLGCEADKVRFRTQCEMERAAANAACFAEKGVKIAACEVEKAAKKLGCEANKAWLQMVNGADLGRVTGDYRFDQTLGKVLLNGGSVSNDLTKINLDLTLSGTTRVGLSADFQPYDLGYIACQFPVNFNIATDLQVKPQRLSLASNRTGSDVEDGVLRLRYETVGTKVTVSTDQPPALKMTLENPEFVVKCLPAAAGISLAALSKKFREDLIRSDFEVDVQPFKYEIGVPGFDVPVFDDKVRFTPRESKSTLWYRGEVVEAN